VIHNIPPQRLASPKALDRVVPTLLLLLGRLPEFNFFRLSSTKTYFGFLLSCLAVLLSGKEENYVNSIGFTLTKLNCLTVFLLRTIYLFTFERAMMFSIIQGLN